MPSRMVDRSTRGGHSLSDGKGTGHLCAAIPRLTKHGSFRSAPAFMSAFGFPCRSILSANAGEMGVAQIELPLNPAPRLVLELTAAIEIIDQVSLGSDQEILDLVATLHEQFMAVVVAASVLDMF